MDLTSKVLVFAAGCLVGFVVGSFVTVYRMRNEATPEGHKKSLAQSIALFFVVALTVYASFASQRAQNGVERNQGRIFRIATCNSAYLGSTIDALTERTQYAQQTSKLQAQMQKDQNALLTILLQRPEVSEEVRTGALKKYQMSLKAADAVREKALAKTITNPYPDASGLQTCIVDGIGKEPPS